MKTGVERIAGERRRQIEVEGWTAAEDDEHDSGSLAQAGAAYALAACGTGAAFELETVERERDEAVAAERLRCACLVAAQMEDSGDRAAIALGHILRPDADYDRSEVEGQSLEGLRAALAGEGNAND